MDNAKVIEALEKVTAFNYFERLLETKVHRVVLFSVFPYTAAPNLSDAHSFIIVDEPAKLTLVNGGQPNN
jgi:hypothetical protein